MGTWGTAPWDSDAAADWFGDLMDKTGLAKYVENTLHMEIEEGFYDDGRVVRAAAAILVLLGHTFVWPVDDLDSHLTLAVSRLEEILRRGYGTYAEKQILAEISVLKARIEERGKAIKTEKVEWWCF